MANPRQRRKARSSSYKPVSHSRHAKSKLKKMPPIRGPKALQEAWDSKKTVRQNYASIGLVHTLNPSLAGGVEPHQMLEPPIDAEDQAGSAQMAPLIPKGYGKITRDEEGNIVGVEMPEEVVEHAPPDFEQMREPDIDGAVLKPWVTDLGGSNEHRSSKGDTAVVQVLKGISTRVDQDGRTMSISTISGNGRRHASVGEVRYLERLVERYGDDIERMAVDGKLNPEQRTAGSLKRALEKAGLVRRS